MTTTTWLIVAAKQFNSNQLLESTLDAPLTRPSSDHPHLFGRLGHSWGLLIWLNGKNT